MCISDLQFEVIESVQFKRTGPEVRERERERERIYILQQQYKDSKSTTKALNKTKTVR